MTKESVSIRDIKKVLEDTKTIVKHHNELMIAKGEHFNMFSVLGIETKENKTHSAFLSELLNPDGSHKMGNIFLKLFIDTIKHNNQFEKENSKYFNIESASVKVEKNVGTINLRNKKNEDPSKASGGRIDIYIKDSNGNVISIENKIHADDQEAQIQRYCNHKRKRNTVYYLTLTGESPQEFSCLKLKAGEDFYNISYRDDIINWLELCLKEVPNFTGLREAINQYILLIKKLTHILNKEQQKPLNDIILKHLDESEYIANNYQKIINKLRGDFRKAIIRILTEKLKSGYYLVEEGSSVTNKYSQIWIRLKSNPQPYFLFGVESFSGAGSNGGNMFVGLISVNNSPVVSKLPDENRINKSWRQTRLLKTEELNSINLSQNNILKILSKPSSEDYNILLNNCCEQIISFVEDYEKILPKELFKEII